MACSNTIAQTNASQSVTATKLYDAFGLQVASTGTWKSPFAYGGPWGYQEDGDAYGLKLLGHRYYDPSLGRFLSRDPGQAGRNWYSYANSDPIAHADPEGLLPKDLVQMIRELIRDGLVPPGSAKRFQKDKTLRKRIHDEVSRQKNPGGGNKKRGEKMRKNPDLPEKEVKEILEDELQMAPVPMPASSRWYDRVNWKLLLASAAVVTGVVVVTIASGGTASGPAVGAAGAILLTAAAGKG